MEKFLYLLFNPGTILRVLWQKIPLGSFELRSKFNAIKRPHFAFGIFHAAQLAKGLGLERISVIEFGVARGDGLLNMEKLANEVEKELGVQIEIYGFDTGTGLTPPADYRDMPYYFSEGLFRMDVDWLTKRLKKAKLILGDVKDTAPAFVERERPAPVGFISFDMDMYSPTKDAPTIFDLPPECLMPRVFCWFDDVIDEDAIQLFNEYTGELLAIKEFNEESAHKKMCKINGFYSSRYVRRPWNEAMYVLHDFKHPRYNSRTNR